MNRLYRLLDSSLQVFLHYLLYSFKGWDSIEGDSIPEDGYIFAPVITTYYY